MLRVGTDLALIGSGMMVPITVEAADRLACEGISVALVNVPTIKPLDTETILGVITATRGVVVAENHSIVGGLASAVAETMAEAGMNRPLRRFGIPDTFAEGAASASYLFARYGLDVNAVLGAAWGALGMVSRQPIVIYPSAASDSYAPI